jgi:ABC-2 type transport system ATP-binding protein
MGFSSRHHSLAARAQIGYLPGEMGIYPELTGIELLNFLAGLRPEPVNRPWRSELLERLELPEKDLRRKVREYSTGMKRKLGIVQAMESDPPLLILDEPTEGLDPLMQESFYELVKELKSKGRTVFMSSHVLSEVERICDRVALLRKGELVFVSELEKLRELSSRRVCLQFSTDVARLNGLPPGARVILWDGQNCELEVTGPVGPLITALSNLPIHDVEIREPRLEDMVLKYYRDDAP